MSLDRGVTNALNPELVARLRDAVGKLAADPSCRGLVLTSANPKFFSIGLDIPELLPLGRSEFVSFWRSFNQLSLDLHTLDGPTVAAITGHAIAGGCVLALCCDYRLIVAGRKLMGLNEVKLGVPVPFPADCMLHALVGTRRARDIMESGDFFEPDRLRELGVVDAVVPDDVTSAAGGTGPTRTPSIESPGAAPDPRPPVVTESIARVRALTDTPAAYAVIKQNRIEPVVARIRERLKEKESVFVDCWFSMEARARLEEASKKF